MRTRSAARLARGARGARRAVRADQQARPGVRRPAAAARGLRLDLAAPARRHRCRRWSRRSSCRRRRSRSTGRRRCSASTRAGAVVAPGLRRRSRLARARAKPASSSCPTPETPHDRVSRAGPPFWIAYAVVSLAALAGRRALFPLAIPLVNLDITQNRADALAKARVARRRARPRAARARSGPLRPRRRSTQNYVELEGGGKPAFAALTSGKLYSPYWWEVRLFTPGEIEESTLRFRPDGAPLRLRAPRRRNVRARCRRQGARTATPRARWPKRARRPTGASISRSTR